MKFCITIILVCLSTAAWSADAPSAAVSDKDADKLIQKMCKACPIARAFKENDGDMDQKVSPGELAAAFVKSQKVSEKQKKQLEAKATQMIKHFDKSADGKLSKAEYAACFTKKKK